MHSERQGALFKLRILKAVATVSFANRSRRARYGAATSFYDIFRAVSRIKNISIGSGYKWTAHQRWQEILGQEEHRALIRRGQAMEVAALAVRIESRTNLLFSFEKNGSARCREIRAWREIIR
jgi:plasmid replication initiation protein